MNAQLAMFVVSVLFSGMNILVFLRAASRFGKLELMVETMWDSFKRGEFAHRPDGVAHDAEVPHEDGQ